VAPRPWTGRQRFETGAFAGGFDILSSDIVPLQKATNGKLYIGPQSQAVVSEICAS